MLKTVAFFAYTFLIGALLTACLAESPNSNHVRTGTATATPKPTIIIDEGYGDGFTMITATPWPTEPYVPQPKKLVICLGLEPESLYLYGSASLEQRNILEAVYDGPFDTNDYGYQPVILEKIPSLADGDAVLQPVVVQEGDLVVDTSGNPVNLTVGIQIYPAGCQTANCAITFDGGETLMDQLSVNFTLLAEVKWSDGEPLTAYDSVYSYQLDADPATPTSKYRIERTASYTALDEHTIRWVGLPGFLDQTYQTNFWLPLPEHAWHTIPPERLLYSERSAWHPLGWGPYIIEQWEKGVEIRLIRNPHYFRLSERLTSVDQVIFRFVGQEANVNLAKIMSSECDVLDRTANLIDQVQLVREVSAAGQMEFHFSLRNVWEHADFSLLPVDYDDGYQPDTDRPDFFADVRTRRAIVHCINRQQIIEAVLLGLGEIPTTFIPSTHPFYTPNIKNYPYDPATGKALLDEIGWRDVDRNPSTPRVAQGIPHVPDGTAFTLAYITSNTPTREKVTAMVAENLDECGINLQLIYLSSADFFAGAPTSPVFGRRFDMAEFAWSWETVPMCDRYMTRQIPGENLARFPNGWEGTNLAGYSNLAFDTACQAIRSLLPGQPGYIEAYHIAQQIFAEDLPAIPLYFWVQITASRPDFCGELMDPTAKSDFWNLEAYDYGDEC